MKLSHRCIAVAALSIVSAAAFASGPKPTADELLTSIKAIAQPKFDPSKRSDKDYIKQYISDLQKSNDDRNKLILEMYHDYPDNEEVPALMEQRWATLVGQDRSKENLEAAEKDALSATGAGVPLKIRSSASYWNSYYKLMEFDGDSTKMLAAVDEFTKAYPSDDRGGRLLTMVSYQVPDQATVVAINKRILKDYPNSKGAKYAKGIVHRAEAIGKPFELTFTDAVSGRKVSISDFKGKIVLVDFWATWCGPCMAEMPHVKDVYAKYHNKGLEIVGVSLDQSEAQGGLTKLKDVVAKQQMAWPQYYQGNYWDSEFSTSWGVNSIPCMFIIDKQGNLLDVNGRQDMEKKVDDLMKG